MKKQSTIWGKPFWISLLWKQNKYHKHGVIIHTLRVVWYVFRDGDYRMITAALLHDIGKPVAAYQKPEDIQLREYSFTDHEERGYQIIKNWPFLSDYTKQMVRYHYLIRDIDKHRIKEPNRAEEKQAIWDNLDFQLQKDLERFLKYDDLGKGIPQKYNTKGGK